MNRAPTGGVCTGRPGMAWSVWASLVGIRPRGDEPDMAGITPVRCSMAGRKLKGGPGLGAKRPSTVYEIKVTLRGIRPPVWRRLHVAQGITLAELHDVIQRAFGWIGCHLHEFDVDGVHFEPAHSEADPMSYDEARVTLAALAPMPGAKLTYTYDFGDDWRHDVLFEKELPADPEVTYPICVKGRRATPPEDCGGRWGYAELLEALGDARHSRHAEMVQWAGGPIDPEAFDLGETNQRLHDPSFGPPSVAELLTGPPADAGPGRARHLTLITAEEPPPPPVLDLDTAEQVLLRDFVLTNAYILADLPGPLGVVEGYCIELPEEDWDELAAAATLAAYDAEDRALRRALLAFALRITDVLIRRG
jgi:hypothetical protein